MTYRELVDLNNYVRKTTRRFIQIRGSILDDTVEGGIWVTYIDSKYKIQDEADIYSIIVSMEEEEYYISNIGALSPKFNQLEERMEEKRQQKEQENQILKNISMDNERDETNNYANTSGLYDDEIKQYNRANANAGCLEVELIESNYNKTVLHGRLSNGKIDYIMVDTDELISHIINSVVHITNL